MAFDYNKRLIGKFHKRNNTIYKIRDVSADNTFGLLNLYLTLHIGKQDHFGKFLVSPYQMPHNNNEEAFCKALCFDVRNVNIFRLINQ